MIDLLPLVKWPLALRQLRNYLGCKECRQNSSSRCRSPWPAQSDGAPRCCLHRGSWRVQPMSWTSLVRSSVQCTWSLAEGGNCQSVIHHHSVSHPVISLTSVKANCLSVCIIYTILQQVCMYIFMITHPFPNCSFYFLVLLTKIMSIRESKRFEAI